jgi:hypothetical protein
MIIKTNQREVEFDLDDARYRVINEEDGLIRLTLDNSIAVALIAKDSKASKDASYGDIIVSAVEFKTIIDTLKANPIKPRV